MRYRSQIYRRLSRLISASFSANASCIYSLSVDPRSRPSRRSDASSVRLSSDRNFRDWSAVRKRLTLNGKIHSANKSEFKSLGQGETAEWRNDTECMRASSTLQIILHS